MHYDFYQPVEEFPHTHDEAARTARARLYLAALKGDWKSVKDMPNIQREISKKRETSLYGYFATTQSNGAVSFFWD